MFLPPLANIESKPTSFWPPEGDSPLPVNKIAPVPYSSPFSISICSFNILAQSYCSPRSHKNLPDASFVFDVNKRLALIRKSLKKLTASFDVLCLQEVDIFEDVLQSFMEELGYNGVCVRRGHGDSAQLDGCAIFYRRSVWTCAEFEEVHFDDLASLGSTSNSSDTFEDGKDDKDRNSSYDMKGALYGIVRSLLRKNTAALMVLEHVETKQKVAVSSAHLYWNPDYEYVKVAQSKYLTDRIYSLAKRHSANPINMVIPVLICGDFNSMPNSFVYNFLSEGVIDGRQVAPWRYFSDHDDDMDNCDVTAQFQDMIRNEEKKDYEHSDTIMKTKPLIPKWDRSNGLKVNDAPLMYSPKNDVELLDQEFSIEEFTLHFSTANNSSFFRSLKVFEWLRQDLKHDFKLKSACDDIVFTNVTSDFVGALDHIFYEHERWVVTKRLHIPKTFKELNSRGTINGHLLPSAKWPSDHLPIGAILAFKPIPKHVNDCACGCIPKNIFSVFEMAEMRKQLRAKKDEESHHHDHEHSDVYYNSEEEYL